MRRKITFYTTRSPLASKSADASTEDKFADIFEAEFVMEIPTGAKVEETEKLYRVTVLGETLCEMDKKHVECWMREPMTLRERIFGL